MDPQIFSMLPPQDLVSLTRANTLFRATLLDRSAVTVWMTARVSTGAPAPLSDFSEARWMKLLFGGSHCGVCALIYYGMLSLTERAGLQRTNAYGCRVGHM